MNTRQHILRRLITGALITGLCSGALGTASAAESSTDQVTRSIVVRYGDLNLSSASGVETLYKRIRKAATIACSDSGPSIPTTSTSRYRECTQHAIEAAVTKVNNKVLTAMHQQKMSRRLG